jgi:hypothetical protein
MIERLIPVGSFIVGLVFFLRSRTYAAEASRRRAGADSGRLRLVFALAGLGIAVGSLLVIGGVLDTKA